MITTTVLKYAALGKSLDSQLHSYSSFFGYYKTIHCYCEDNF